ncbi:MULTISPECIES: 2-C-methyl-D-erythritol 4-phosphate cytidylyltransferase [unclassified Agarivorans]|uniref:2-C-methyl-D-erythritol 4-phosphate cytidylyltransferase n=1 Tax=unclassified Agarivorans TaxID=2636026 RepID=UPI0026E434BD|nr:MULTISPECIES: 2-C-methyl-D-erythritol 4-phosphate cytidylyltransferase [unclassified Agarivorans]MDO6684290.1 2-C-methyl-D-erythritol 4-phosphate cytidylyltransferase [Agarivorans sp. 3_MG-2023]MDO6714456.1 2-C-methyl-D-erythritol 4-phosphate cytidylyltransferase [Agarivorans sp. 2_MG-2023]
MISSIKQYTALLPAAGIGSRMQASIPKQYLSLGEKTILETTAAAFLSHPAIAKVIVVLHPNDRWFKDLSIACSPSIQTVEGGDERADSVLAGLQTINDDEWVLVHDAARPCITHQDISLLIASCEQHQHGGILASPVRDTMKRSADGKVEHTVSREQLWHALTPQMFLVQSLKQNISNAMAAGEKITDEASAMEWAEQPVSIIEGRSDNIKVTCPEDLALAKWYLSQQQQKEVVG